jgi:hypothetical protein
MELNLKVSVGDDDTCGINCPFLDITECLLFNKQLNEIILPKGYVWQDDTNPLRQRDYRCNLATA